MRFRKGGDWCRIVLRRGRGGSMLGGGGRDVRRRGLRGGIFVRLVRGGGRGRRFGGGMVNWMMFLVLIVRLRRLKKRELCESVCRFCVSLILS